jgi:hypothetical protein
MSHSDRKRRRKDGGDPGQTRVSRHFCTIPFGTQGDSRVGTRINLSASNVANAAPGAAKTENPSPAYPPRLRTTLGTVEVGDPNPGGSLSHFFGKVRPAMKNSFPSRSRRPTSSPLGRGTQGWHFLGLGINPERRTERPPSKRRGWLFIKDFSPRITGVMYNKKPKLCSVRSATKHGEEVPCKGKR